ncbi:MAG: hypothetical protein ACI8Z9_002484, partial [Paraglaciecola sp.]
MSHAQWLLCIALGRSASSRSFTHERYYKITEQQPA